MSGSLAIALYEVSHSAAPLVCANHTIRADGHAFLWARSSHHRHRLRGTHEEYLVAVSTEQYRQAVQFTCQWEPEVSIADPL